MVTPLRSFAFLAFLMVFSSTGTTRAAMEENINPAVNDPFQSTSCSDGAQMYCEQTITPAIEQDSTDYFTLDERERSKANATGIGLPRGAPVMK